MQELHSLLNCVQKLEFHGRESITRLVCLNRLAHLATLASIERITDEEDLAFAEEQVRHMERFTRNRRCLNCMEILIGDNVRLGFGKVKQRLVEDIRFFLGREQGSPMRQKMLHINRPTAPQAESRERSAQLSD